MYLGRLVVNMNRVEGQGRFLQYAEAGRPVSVEVVVPQQQVQVKHAVECPEKPHHETQTVRGKLRGVADVAGNHDVPVTIGAGVFKGLADFRDQGSDGACQHAVGSAKVPV
jgi:hypothetical protein